MLGKKAWFSGSVLFLVVTGLLSSCASRGQLVDVCGFATPQGDVDCIDKLETPYKPTDAQKMDLLCFPSKDAAKVVKRRQGK